MERSTWSKRTGWKGNHSENKKLDDAYRFKKINTRYHDEKKEKK